VTLLQIKFSALQRSHNATVKSLQSTGATP
jgi:hypothetical protein